jgi:general secretion pathway protein H
VQVFYPSGEATPYEMAIIPGRFDEGETQRVEITMMGDLVWVNRDRAEELENEW